MLVYPKIYFCHWSRINLSLDLFMFQERTKNKQAERKKNTGKYTKLLLEEASFQQTSLYISVTIMLKAPF